MESILPPKFYGEKDLKHTLIHPHLGEGAYGCVISPPLNVENAKGNILNQYHDIKDTDVSKLFGDIDDCKKEIITIIKIYELFKDNLKTQKTKPKWKKIITRPVKINNFYKLI